jgi:glycerol-3-phosphate dehydrogenase
VVDPDGRVSLDGRQRVRDHANGPDALEGLISIAGTKYTTARSVAEQITDRLFAKLGRSPVPCRTATTPLPGADADTPAPDGDARAWPPDVRAHIEAAYGPAGRQVMHLAEADPALAERVAEPSPVVAAQLVWSVRHEMAMTLADVIVRRTPLGALGHPGASAVQRAAAVVARECGWDAPRAKREVAAVDAFYGT